MHESHMTHMWFLRGENSSCTSMLQKPLQTTSLRDDLWPLDERMASVTMEVSQVALSVQRGWEAHVVESTRYSIAARVGCHSLDTVLGLIWWQLLSQDLGSNVRLKRKWWTNFSFHTWRRKVCVTFCVVTALQWIVTVWIL